MIIIQLPDSRIIEIGGFEICRNWCDDNCKGNHWYRMCLFENYSEWEFELNEDAILFSLTFI